MNKKLILLFTGLVLTTGHVFAQEVKMDASQEVVAVDTQAAVEVGNTICPLTGRTLNLNDNNDFTKLEVEGFIFNVCPKGKAIYNKDVALYADKLSQAVTAVKSSKTVVIPEVEEVVTTPLPMEVEPVDAAVPVSSSEEKPVDEAVPAVENIEVVK